MAKLSLTNIWKTYGGAQAVRGVSLEVESGEFVSFLGPSGSGKTTTLSMVAGFISPTGGNIRIDGRDITNVPPHQRNIGMVFQDYSLFPHMNVAQNVAFPLAMRSVDKADSARRVSDVMEIVGLHGMGQRLPIELSGGQQQRVAIARAIVYQPQILLMDEPLGALDRLLRERLQLEIKQIQKRLGITTLYVTHDQGEALTMSDRVCVFNDGEIAQVGSPVSLYERPESRFIAGFVGESNFLSATVEDCVRCGDGWQCLLVLECSAKAKVLASQPFSAGTQLTASIRPEHIRLCSVDCAEDANTVFVTAKVNDVVYRGETSTLRGQLESGAEISARATVTDVARFTGETVRLRWPTDKIVLLNK
ncbi:ABC transporter ATP-binding protein [Rhizobium sp. Root482]|uniref:ABC transporter ATP-binding protein n=1 Tax=Rhizobium sp. Root482 TaxID=1736543 RepID=UPI0006FCAEF0|nr:ABC transporter ATP-binding protein [Rhizobium sp. Root482]KQY19134.1 hypothetical protein ASD31_24280 [Rhizobium sp. Root482]